MERRVADVLGSSPKRGRDFRPYPCQITDGRPDVKHG